MEVAKAIHSVAAAGLLDDPAVLGPLITCLDYPLLSVSATCQSTLFTLTQHDFVQPFDLYRRPPKTEEARRRLINDWRSWQRQMQDGHALLDKQLRSLLLSSLDDLMKRLATVLKNLYLTAMEQIGRAH